MIFYILKYLTRIREMCPSKKGVLAIIIINTKKIIFEFMIMQIEFDTTGKNMPWCIDGIYKCILITKIKGNLTLNLHGL